MTLKNALKIIHGCSKESRDRFDVEFLSCDVKRKKYGDLKVLTRCRLASSSHDAMKHGTINVLHNGSLTEQTIHIHLIMKVNGQFIIG